MRKIGTAQVQIRELCPRQLCVTKIETSQVAKGNMYVREAGLSGKA